MACSIAINPDSGSDGVRLHAFQEALPVRNFRRLDARSRRHVLIGAGFQKFSNP
jgi:hypothetical protein